MRTENLHKYFAPKSPMISDSPAATATEALSISEVMAAIGMVEAKCKLGLELFLAKIGVSSPEKAIRLLTEKAGELAGKHKAISKLDTDVKTKLLQTVATFAYQDYSRSAASKRECPCCKGEGFIEAEVFSMKSVMGKVCPSGTVKISRVDVSLASNVTRKVREVERVLCPSCEGKKVITNSCRCHGKGKVLDKAGTEKQGVPVWKDCPKCNARGYALVPSETIRKAVCITAINISQPTWSRNFKPFVEELTSECLRQESMADGWLSSVTR